MGHLGCEELGTWLCLSAALICNVVSSNFKRRCRRLAVWSKLVVSFAVISEERYIGCCN
jgi:hypothetical protein